VLECRRIGRPPPGVPPGELAQDGAIRILGVIRVLSDKRLLVNVLATLRKLLSLVDGEVNQPPNIAKQMIKRHEDDKIQNRRRSNALRLDLGTLSRSGERKTLAEGGEAIE